MLVAAALLATLGASAVHAWNMEGAALSCESGSVIRGGWAEPDTCTGTDGHPAERGPLDLVDPWTSALAAAVIIGGFAALSIRAVAALNGLALWAATRRFLLVAALLVGAAAVLWNTVLGPS